MTAAQSRDFGIGKSSGIRDPGIAIPTWHDLIRRMRFPVSVLYPGSPNRLLAYDPSWLQHARYTTCSQYFRCTSDVGNAQFPPPDSPGPSRRVQSGGVNWDNSFSTQATCSCYSLQSLNCTKAAKDDQAYRAQNHTLFMF